MTEGGTPFAQIDSESQAAITELMALIGTIDDLCRDGKCPLILVKVNLMSLQQIAKRVLVCDAPNNTIMPPAEHGVSEEAAEIIASAIEIPDNVADILGEGDE